MDTRPHLAKLKDCVKPNVVIDYEVIQKRVAEHDGRIIKYHVEANIGITIPSLPNRTYYLYQSPFIWAPISANSTEAIPEVDVPG
ncbi:hypothetical protein D5018_16860 [Parashewanella curva]|uniref:Uncharacterized protein n=1 Tax=Parashewanella curva TaxID=2338552 RepID=A0A3L8PVB6_9GAMM|nr:hypothetical protein [Parashewanella curva]RLV58523.1 hypothetical protein D5018_16860 [Parashewanella curva]